MADLGVIAAVIVIHAGEEWILICAVIAGFTMLAKIGVVLIGAYAIVADKR